MAIGRIRKKDLHQIDVEEADSGDSEWKIADLDKSEISIDDQESNTDIQDHCPREDEASVEFPQVIPIDKRTPIATFWIETHCYPLETTMLTESVGKTRRKCSGCEAGDSPIHKTASKPCRNTIQDHSEG